MPPPIDEPHRNTAGSAPSSGTVIAPISNERICRRWRALADERESVGGGTMPLVGVYHGRSWPSGSAEDVDFSALLPDVPGVAELEAEGFVPLETLLGQTEFGSAWPTEHRRIVEDTRYEQTGSAPWSDEDAMLYMVRSPWPSIEIDTAIKLMWRWLHRNEDRYSTRENEWVSRGDKAAQLAVVEEYFRQSEAWVRAYNRGRVNRVR